jgi:hypothetical protein
MIHDCNGEAAKEEGEDNKILLVGGKLVTYGC